MQTLLFIFSHVIIASSVIILGNQYYIAIEFSACFEKRTPSARGQFLFFFKLLPILDYSCRFTNGCVATTLLILHLEYNSKEYPSDLEFRVLNAQKSKGLRFQVSCPNIGSKRSSLFSSARFKLFETRKLDEF